MFWFVVTCTRRHLSYNPYSQKEEEESLQYEIHSRSRPVPSHYILYVDFLQFLYTDPTTV